MLEDDPVCCHLSLSKEAWGDVEVDMSETDDKTTLYFYAPSWERMAAMMRSMSLEVSVLSHELGAKARA